MLNPRCIYAAVVAVVTQAVVGEGERGNGRKAAGGKRDEPTYDNALDERLDLRQTAGLDKVDVGDVVAGEAVASGTVEIGGW